MTNTIDISGLDKAAVLAGLFNASAPQGMGFLQAGHGPQVMTVEDAQKVIDQQGGGLYFDYVFGRPLKSSLEGDQFDTWGFDRDNGGEGSAERVIQIIRQTGEVETKESHDRRTGLTLTKAHEAMEMANTPSVPIRDDSGSVVGLEMGCSDVGDILERAVDSQMDRIRRG